MRPERTLSAETPIAFGLQRRPLHLLCTRRIPSPTGPCDFAFPSTMQSLNLWVFQHLSLAPNTAMPLVDLVHAWAEAPLFVVPATLVVGWLMGGTRRRVAMLHATAAAFIALGAAQVMGLLWPHPRPFALGLSPLWSPHLNDSSFPSDHLTLLSAVATAWACHPVTRQWALAMALLAIPVAWARIALGLHFPADMLGALAAGGLGTISVDQCLRRPLLALTRIGIASYRWLAGPLIARRCLRA